MSKLESAESLVAALVNVDDYLAFCDILMSLKETQLALPGRLNNNPILFTTFITDVVIEPPGRTQRPFLCEGGQLLPAPC